MTNPTPNFIHRLKAIGFSGKERLAMRERLALYAAEHPVAAAGPVPSYLSFFASRRFSIYAGAFIALVVVGSGVTLAADNSVPGDALYAVKINVNEPVMVALAPTATGQAEVAAQLASRRVDEAVTLASRGDLTDERQKYLAQQFDAKVALASARTGTLAQNDPSAAVRVNDEFAANLAGEAEALGAVVSTHPDQGSKLLESVVAATQNLSENADSGDTSILVSTTNMGSTTPAALSATTTATSTAGRLFSEHRFSRYLRIASSTEFRSRIASSSAPTNAPVNISIPQIGGGSASAETQKSDSGSDLEIQFDR